MHKPSPRDLGFARTWRAQRPAKVLQGVVLITVFTAFERSGLSSHQSLLPAGNAWTAAAHVITAVIGSGVLSLAYSLSTMGWVAGSLILFAFAFVTWYMSMMLADAYRNPINTGKRNYTYPDAVKNILGKCSCLRLSPDCIIHGCICDMIPHYNDSTW